MTMYSFAESEIKTTATFLFLYGLEEPLDGLHFNSELVVMAETGNRCSQLGVVKGLIDDLQTHQFSIGWVRSDSLVGQVMIAD